jgi:hypothetical protein
MMGRNFTRFLQLLLSGIFLFSAIAKLLSLGFFEISLIEQGVTGSRLVAARLARVLIGFELFLGLALLLPYFRKKLIIPLTLATLAGFTIFLVLSLWNATQAENCGCFGDLVKMSTGQSIIKNIVLMALVLLLYQRLGPDSKNWRIPTALAIVCIAGIALFYPAQPVENNAFSKYRQFEPVGRVDLLTGEHIVAILDPNCERCIETVLELSYLSGEYEVSPNIVFLFGSDSAADIEMFFATTGTRYPYAKISSEEMFSLIGEETPRFYLLKQGDVQAYWDDNIIPHLEEAFARSNGQ